MLYGVGLINVCPSTTPFSQKGATIQGGDESTISSIRQFGYSSTLTPSECLHLYKLFVLAKS